MPKIEGSNYLLMLWEEMGRTNTVSPFSFTDINQIHPELTTWDKVTIKKMSESYFKYLPLFVTDCEPPYMTDEERQKAKSDHAKRVINSWKA